MDTERLLKRAFELLGDKADRLTVAVVNDIYDDLKRVDHRIATLKSDLGKASDQRAQLESDLRSVTEGGASVATVLAIGRARSHVEPTPIPSEEG